MSSEIRANTLKNRVGLSTINITNTGIVVSGISTFNRIQSTGRLDVLGNTDGNVQASFTRANDGNFQIQFRNESSNNGAGYSQGKFGLFYDATGTDIAGMQFLRGSGTGAGSLIFTTGGSERLRIDSSGKIGINNNSPTSQLDGANDLVIGDTSDADSGITLVTTTSGQGLIHFSDATSGNARYDGFIGYEQTSRALKFGTAQTEKLRITAAGNLQTAGITTSNTGFMFGTGGQHYLYQSASDTATLRITSDGPYVQFKDVSGDVQMGSASGTLRLSAGGVERLRINQHGGLRVFAAASDPTGIEAGEIYYNTSTNRLRVYNGSKWLNPDENKDPYASDVVCQFNGDSYTDLTGRHTLTQVGSGGLSNNYMSPVGSTSTYRMAHSNSNGNYMNITGNLGDFRLDDGNWTMEFWVRTTGTNGYSHYFVADGQGSKGTFKGYTNNSSVTEMAYFYSSNGSGVSYNPGGSPFAYNDWQHYAWDRSGSTTRFYLDGVVRASSTAAYPGGVPTLCNIGKWSNEAKEFYMDNFRFTRGQARYGGNGFEVPRTKYTSG